MKDISSISHLLHLDLPLPEHCNMTMELNHTDTDASGRPLLVLKHLSPECGCTHEVENAARFSSQSSFSSKTTVSKNCRSALTHYAWGVGCHSMMTLYHSTCTRYRGKQHKKAEPSTKIGDSSDTTSSSSDDTNTTKPADIATFITNKMPSFQRSCDILSQLVHFRCILLSQRH